MAPSYRLGKGSIVRKLEKHLESHADFTTAHQELRVAVPRLRAGQPLQRLTSFENSLRADRDDNKHLQVDIFGGSGGVERRKVYYEGLLHALELALQYKRNQDHARLDIVWGCGHPRNECRVTWTTTNGVTVVHVTLLSNVAAMGRDAEHVREVDDVAGAGLGENGLLLVQPGPSGVVTLTADEDFGISQRRPPTNDSVEDPVSPVTPDLPENLR